MSKIRMKFVSRRAFTLIELLLAIAITLIFVSLVFSTFYIVNSSHAKVVVLNDAKDYASLNMDAISNLMINSDKIILSNSQIHTADEINYTSIYYDSATSSILNYSSTSGSAVAFSYDQYTISGGTVKWKVSPTFSKANAHSVKIILDIFDNATNELYYSLTRTVYLPNIDKGSAIIYSDTAAETKSTVINFHSADYTTGG